MLHRNTRYLLFTALLATIVAACGFDSHAAAGEATADAVVQALTQPPADAASRRFRQWLRHKVVRPADDTRFGLHLDAGWQEQDPSRAVVIVVHGFNSGIDRNAAFQCALRNADFPTGGFAYPNDYRLSDSAVRLSIALRQFREAHPQRRVALVTHSMGGLVARACLEDPALDPGNVERLIMIAPPSQGTLVAYAAVATDVWEHWLSRESGSPWRRWRDSVVDGLGEAADDLVPDSPFLTELNRRLRNPRVKYSILLGTGATVQNDEIDWLRGVVRKSLGRMPGADESADRIDALLADLDELVEGKGDGVVAVKRGRLEGVDDVLVVPFGHLAVTGKAASSPVRVIQMAVLERLK